MTDINLDQMRQDIDNIDEKLTDLFKERMEKSLEIAKYKKNHKVPVFSDKREKEILHKVSEQNNYMAKRSDLADRIEEALKETPNLFPKKAVVACQGVAGSYSQAACEKLFEVPSIMYFNSFEGVFNAVEKGLCQYGILPIENSTAGSVNATYDLMTRHNFSIVRSARLKVSHNLLAKAGTGLADIKEVFSHEQAINQCSAFLSGLKGVKVTVVPNTAVAARMVSQSERRDVAALSSRFCGETYGLELLRANVQDRDNNYTRFICISQKPEIYPGADRTSLMMTLPHKPGALYHVLSKFYALGINLQKLESRPLPDREFEFMFYFDLECSVYAPEMERLFRDLEEESEQCRYLGTYQEVIC